MVPAKTPSRGNSFNRITDDFLFLPPTSSQPFPNASGCVGSITGVNFFSSHLSQPDEEGLESLSQKLHIELAFFIRPGEAALV